MGENNKSAASLKSKETFLEREILFLESNLPDLSESAKESGLATRFVTWLATDVYTNANVSRNHYFAALTRARVDLYQAKIFLNQDHFEEAKNQLDQVESGLKRAEHAYQIYLQKATRGGESFQEDIPWIGVASTGVGAVYLGLWGLGGSILIHGLGFYTLKSETPDLEAQTQALIQEARRGLEEFRKDPKASFPYGPFLLKAQMLQKGLLPETQEKVIQSWEEFLKASRDAIDPKMPLNHQIYQVTLKTYLDLLQYYDRDSADMLEVVLPRALKLSVQAKSNCHSRNETLISNYAVNFPLPPGKRWLLQEFTDHIRPVLVDEDAITQKFQRLWAPFDGQVAREVKSPLLYPQVILHDFLISVGEEPPTQRKDFLYYDAPMTDFRGSTQKGFSPPPLPLEMLESGQPKTDSTWRAYSWEEFKGDESFYDELRTQFKSRKFIYTGYECTRLIFRDASMAQVFNSLSPDLRLAFLVSTVQEEFSDLFVNSAKEAEETLKLLSHPKKLKEVSPDSLFATLRFLGSMGTVLSDLGDSIFDFDIVENHFGSRQESLDSYNRLYKKLRDNSSILSSPEMKGLVAATLSFLAYMEENPEEVLADLAELPDDRLNSVFNIFFELKSHGALYSARYQMDDYRGESNIWLRPLERLLKDPKRVAFRGSSRQKSSPTMPSQASSTWQAREGEILIELENPKKRLEPSLPQEVAPIFIPRYFVIEMANKGRVLPDTAAKRWTPDVSAEFINWLPKQAKDPKSKKYVLTRFNFQRIVDERDPSTLTIKNPWYKSSGPVHAYERIPYLPKDLIEVFQAALK